MTIFRTASLVVSLAVLLASAQTSRAASVTTYHNDNARTGVNDKETILNTTNVNSATFGKLFSLPVNGQVYAQPLFVPGVEIPTKGVHNVLYVATMTNWVYAFPAESGSTTPLWAVNLGTAVPCLYFQPYYNDCDETGISGTIGILSTPVIDVSQQAIYVVANTYVPGQTGITTFKLHSLNLSTGQENPGSPVVIRGQVNGTGQGSVGGVLAFSAFDHWQRTGLALVNGSIYFGFASHGDAGPFHGWLFGYDEVTCSGPR